jgi:uncharacterized protein
LLSCRLESKHILPDLFHVIVVLALSFVAATLAAVSGFGGAAVLVPVLAWSFGVREAIPILTVAQLIGNASRAWFNRRELNWRVVTWFALGGVPMALLGGVLFAKAPLPALTRALGIFLIFIVVWRHAAGPQRTWRPSLPSFAAIGAGASFLSALMGSVGPLMAPLFLAYGLVKGAYIGTEALSTVTMHVAKLIAYRHSDVLPLHAVLVGVGLGPVMVLGSYVGKRIVDRLPEKVFVRIIDATLVIAGIHFLWKG